MNIAFQNAMTVQEYLDWAATQSDLPRMELINGRIVAMTPERVEHVEIKPCGGPGVEDGARASRGGMSRASAME